MKFEREFFLRELRASQEFFNRSTKFLTDDYESFSPLPKMFSVREQIAHVGHTIDWFIEGAFSPKGFNLDQAEHIAKLKKVTSVSQARECVGAAFSELFKKVSGLPESEWIGPIVPGVVMGGEPRFHILPSVVEHTAHHRGALTVYARLLGITPPLPYMDL